MTNESTPAKVGSMITFDVDAGRFTYRVGGVCLDEGHVLLQHAVGHDFWVLPGGRCELGESSVEAVARELREEIGVEVLVGDLLWIVENFFAWNGRPFHEIGLYHRIALPPGSPLLDKSMRLDGIVDGGVEIGFRWFRLDALADMAIKPIFVAQRLAERASGPIHIVHRDAC